MLSCHGDTLCGCAGAVAAIRTAPDGAGFEYRLSFDGLPSPPIRVEFMDVSGGVLARVYLSGLAVPDVEGVTTTLTTIDGVASLRLVTANNGPTLRGSLREVADVADGGIDLWGGAPFRGMLRCTTAMGAGIPSAVAALYISPVPASGERRYFAHIDVAGSSDTAQFGVSLRGISLGDAATGPLLFGTVSENTAAAVELNDLAATASLAAAGTEVAVGVVRLRPGRFSGAFAGGGQATVWVRPTGELHYELALMAPGAAVLTSAALDPAAEGLPPLAAAGVGDEGGLGFWPAAESAAAALSVAEGRASFVLNAGLVSELRSGPLLPAAASPIPEGATARYSVLLAPRAIGGVAPAPAVGSARLEAAGDELFFSVEWEGVQVDEVRLGSSTLGSPAVTATHLAGALWGGGDRLRATDATNLMLTLFRAGTIVMSGALSRDGPHTPRSALSSALAFEGLLIAPDGTASPAPAGRALLSSSGDFHVEVVGMAAGPSLATVVAKATGEVLHSATLNGGTASGRFHLSGSAAVRLRKKGLEVRVISGSIIVAVGTLGPARQSRVAVAGAVGSAAAAIVSAVFDPMTGSLSVEFWAMGLSGPPLDNSVVVLSAPATMDEESSATSELSVTFGMARIEPDGLYTARGSVAGGIVLGGGRLSAEQLEAKAVWTVAVRTADGVACSGTFRLVGLADEYRESTMSESASAGMFNAVLRSGGSAFVGRAACRFDAALGILRHRLTLCPIGGASTEDLRYPVDAELSTGRQTVASFPLSSAWRVWTAPAGKSAREDWLNSLANGSMAIVAGPGTTDAVSATLNSEPLFVPFPAAPVLPETAGPETEVFANDPSRRFVYSSSSLEYTSSAVLFGFSDQTSDEVTVQDVGFGFDFGRQQAYAVELTVSDPGSGRTDAVTVPVVLADENNVAPKFPQRTLAVELTEKSPVGTLIKTIEAFDADAAFPELTYSWYRSAEPAIQANTLLFTLVNVVETDALGNAAYRAQISAAAVLSRKDAAVRTVMVEVSDGVNANDVVIVEISVLGINDDPPVFDRSNTTAAECLNAECSRRQGPSVSEDTPVGTVLYSLEATDADDGDNGLLTFATTGLDHPGLSCGRSAGLFTMVPRPGGSSFERILPDSGTRVFAGDLVLARALDFEAQQNHSVCVVAVDRGVPALSSVVQIEILVTDVPFAVVVASSNLVHLEDYPMMILNEPRLKLTAMGNREDELADLVFEQRFERPAADCILSDWEDVGGCEPAPGAQPLGSFGGRPCRYAGAPLGSLTQRRHITQLRDVFGFGADCERVPFASSTALGSPGDVHLFRRQPCATDICPYRCKLAGHAEWMAVSQCVESAKCSAGERLEAQVATATGADVVDCGTLCRTNGEPCGYAGSIGGISTASGMPATDASSDAALEIPGNPVLQDYLNFSINPGRSPSSVFSQWSPSSANATDGAWVGLRVAPCDPLCSGSYPGFPGISSAPSTPNTTTAMPSTSTLSSIAGPMPAEAVAASIADDQTSRMLADTGERNGFLRNHPKFDGWEVGGSWSPRWNWAGSAVQAVGGWNAKMHAEEFGARGAWSRCGDPGDSSGTVAQCVVASDPIPNGPAAVDIRALGDGAVLDVLSIDFMADRDQPMAFIAASPLSLAMQPESPSSNATFDVSYSDTDTSRCGPPPWCRSASDIPRCTPCQSGGGVRYMCRLDGQSWDAFAACPIVGAGPSDGISTRLVFTGLADGPHVLELAAINVANGDVPAELEPVLFNWTIDTKVPRGLISSWPVDRQTTNTSARFEFMSDGGGGSRFRCELDGIAAACGHTLEGGIGSVIYTDLPHGEHLFRLLVSDRAGNIDLTAVPSFAWDVDLAPPIVKFTSAPAGALDPRADVTSTTEWKAHFSADEPVVAFECRMVSAPLDRTGACCNAAFDGKCAPACRTGSVAALEAVCSARDNATLLAFQKFARCLAEDVRRFADSGAGNAIATEWSPCQSPFVAAGLAPRTVYAVEVVGTDRHGHQTSKESPARWVIGVDLLHLSPEEISYQRRLNAVAPPALDCAETSTALVTVCAVVWGLASLTGGLLIRESRQSTEYRGETKSKQTKSSGTLSAVVSAGDGKQQKKTKPGSAGDDDGEVIDETDVSYQEALEMMGIEDHTIADFARTEPGFLDTFGNDGGAGGWSDSVTTEQQYGGMYDLGDEHAGFDDNGNMSL